jgi:adenine-specific DNA-methyltransferase
MTLLELLERIRQRLEAFGQSRDLTLMTRLFCEDLGWGEPRGFTQRRLQLPSPLSCEVQAVTVAQMSGLPVYCVEWPQERLPGVTARRAVQRALSPLSTEHVVCYLTQDGRQLAFTWARRRSDGKIELRTLPYEVGSPPAPPLNGWRKWRSVSMNWNRVNHRSPPLSTG